MKGLRVTKIVKEIKFEAVWGEVESRKGFQRQSGTKYLRLTFKFNFCFPRDFLLVLTKWSF